jgi:probable F420-dependent oxidoreductase
VKFWNSLAFIDVADAIPLAVTSEEVGYDGITIPEHLFYPRTFDSKYPYSADGRPAFTEDSPWPDPWIVIGAMSTHTTRIRFTTNVYVAPLRDLFSVAKNVSTAAALSGGRVALGVGAGWMREEFEQTGQDFETRGKRLNEMIPALRALWTGDWAEYHGEYYDFGPVKMSPVPGAPIPVIVGGHSKVAFRRAAELGDGWMGVHYDVETAQAHIATLKKALADAGRSSDDFEIIIALNTRIDADTVKRMADLGATGMLTAPAMRTEGGTQAKVDAIKRFADKVLSQVR